MKYLRVINEKEQIKIEKSSARKRVKKLEKGTFE